MDFIVGLIVMVLIGLTYQHFKVKKDIKKGWTYVGLLVLLSIVYGVLVIEPEKKAEELRIEQEKVEIQIKKQEEELIKREQEEEREKQRLVDKEIREQEKKKEREEKELQREQERKEIEELDIKTKDALDEWRTQYPDAIKDLSVYDNIVNVVLSNEFDLLLDSEKQEVMTNLGYNINIVSIVEGKEDGVDVIYYNTSNNRIGSYRKSWLGEYKTELR